MNSSKTDMKRTQINKARIQEITYMLRKQVRKARRRRLGLDDIE